MNFSSFYSDSDLTREFIVIYSGRFQPFHINHYLNYKELVDTFGPDRVYIATSDKVEPPRSPFTFTEKKKIMVNVYAIPDDKIIQVVNPYKPDEVFATLDDKNVGYICAIGKKDIDRLTGGKYFVPYAGEKVFDLKHGYVYVLSDKSSSFEGEVITGSLIRTIFRSKNVKRKLQLYNSIYPVFESSIFKLLAEKIK